MKAEKNRKLKPEDINKLLPLFWDYNENSIPANINSPFVIARVLEFGDTEQFNILSKITGDNEIYNLLKTRLKKLLSARSYNFWILYYEKNFTEKTQGRHRRA